ncbi:MAG: LysR family transcriptional regulator [Clostridia bacterium]|nr:LysR family transcriptional regulator [Clostridia bacterium]
MNMTDIEYFLKVAELMSFSKAAEALFVTQQAVSLHVKHLEETYGIRLFERHPSLRLTPAGYRLIDAARDIIDRENRLVSEISNSREQFEGEISIGLPPNRSTAFVNAFFPLFSSAYPNMSLRLDERTSSKLSSAIKRNEIDLALPLQSEYTGRYDPEIFCVIPLETESLYVVISDSMLQEAFPDQYPACKTAFLSGVSLFDFARLPMFLHPASSHLHENIVEKLTLHGTPPFIRIRTSLTSSLVPLCADGYGIFFSTPMLLQHLYATSRNSFSTLNVFPIREYRNNRQTVLLYHRQKYLTKPLEDSIGMIRSIYADHAKFVEHLRRQKENHSI